MINKEEIIAKTLAYVRDKFDGEATGHDWHHIERVYKMSLLIAKKENADLFIVQLAALLHDIADHKFHNGDEEIGPKTVKQWLENFKLDDDTEHQIVSIVKEISFKGAKVATPMSTLEGKIVQDADRLDAIGAIGIARCFAYSGSKGREIYNPKKAYKMHTSFDDYKNDKGSAVNHFYEKLLLLRDLMNTNTGKEIAKHRHNFLENYLTEFLAEWNFNENE